MTNNNSSNNGGTSSNFRQLVEEETKILTEFCEKWENYLKGKEANENDDDEEEQEGEIRATVGQCRMLLDNRKGRLQQFKDLVQQSERPQTRSQTSKGVQQVTDEDLQGFWDMLGFQIDDIKENFQKLEGKILLEDNAASKQTTKKESSKKEEQEHDLVRSLEELNVNEEKKVD